jgi:hypothetical protein
LAQAREVLIRSTRGVVESHANLFWAAEPYGEIWKTVAYLGSGALVFQRSGTSAGSNVLTTISAHPWFNRQLHSGHLHHEYRLQWAHWPPPHPGVVVESSRRRRRHSRKHFATARSAERCRHQNNSGWNSCESNNDQQPLVIDRTRRISFEAPIYGNIAPMAFVAIVFDEVLY